MPITFLKEDNVASLPIKYGDRDTYYWDSSTVGFGLRVYHTGNRVYVVRYKNPNGTQSLKTIGPVADVSLQGARSAAQYRKRKAAEKVAETTTRGYTPRQYTRQKRETLNIQCGYTKEGNHWFKTNNKFAKYCCQAHYHATPKSIKSDEFIPPNTASVPNVIYLPDETTEKSDIALLQQQLDEIEHRIDHLVEEKLQQMVQTFIGNLFALFTKGDK